MLTLENISAWLRQSIHHYQLCDGMQFGENKMSESASAGECARSANEDRRDTISAKFAHTSVEDTVAYFRTNPTEGLLQSDIPGLLARHGYNEFRVSSSEPLLLKFAKTIYENPLVLLLCGSATISAIMGNMDDAVSIAVAVFIVLTVGFIQERRSEESLEALNKLVPHYCHVIRQGETIHILANELVPGDLVTFKTGDRVPADIRVIQAVELEVDESSLTGETEARKKTEKTCVYEPGPLGRPQQAVALAERSCIVHMGTLVRNGYGAGIVISTGSQTEFGLIFSLMSEVEQTRTPLQLSMDDLAKKLSFASFGIIGIICFIGWLQGRGWLEMFTIGVSLAVAAIPEGLPIVTTVTLALGVIRMAKRKAIVKKLHSVEGLGSVNVICSDKTGTLTKNEQTVIEAYVVDETITLDSASTNSRSSISPLLDAFRRMFDIGALCNNASLQRNEEGVYVGQSTDVALINVLPLVGVPDRRESFVRLSERPFSSELKYMAVSGVHPEEEREMYYTKGSIEAILEQCNFYYVNEELTPHLDPITRSSILAKANDAARRGLRVLAVAYGYGGVEMSNRPPPPGTMTTNASPLSKVKEKMNLVFVGFQAMLDPPRTGVTESIALLQSGGVNVVMITGDAEETALSIARKLGLKVGAAATSRRAAHHRAVSHHWATSHQLAVSHHRTPSAPMVGSSMKSLRDRYCLTGKEIDQMSEAQLRERVGTVSVFARTTPRHKMRIVEALQARGMVVAMTGDGVNDAPALKLANIGIAMGKSGTDVAKEAADVILVDDNFSTILPAIEEGKSIFHNIQNFLAFQLSTAAAALILITLSTMLGLSNPLNAMQILFINILMDGPPSQSLGVDPVDPAIMRQPPRKKNASIITRRVLFRVLFSASIIVLGTLFVYVFALSDNSISRREQTMAFTCFVFLDLVCAVQNRGLGCGIVQNKLLITTVSISACVQLVLVYVPFMQKVFQTEGLGLSDLGVLIALAGSSFFLHEGRRRLERRRERSYAIIDQC